MDLQTMAQEALLRSGMRLQYDTISVTSEGLGLEFITAVRDAWRDLQSDSRNWFFRQKMDQTATILSGTDALAMPSGLETINYRTCTVYLTAKTDETPLVWVPYEEWRLKDTVSTGAARPQLITENYESILQVWPVPDQEYTMRYDGVYDIDDMTANGDTPGDTISGGTQLLPDRYHWILVWDAVQRVALAHEDQGLYARAHERYKAERAKLSEKQMPPIYVRPGVLTGAYDSVRHRVRRYF